MSGAVVLTLASCSSPDESGPTTTTTTQTPPAATTPTPTPTPAVLFPGSSWDRDEQGDFDALDVELQQAGSTCVAVVKDGALVHDAYWNGGAPEAKHRVYSITKSLAALLAGTFVGDEALDLDASASEHVDEWAGTAAEEVTLRDLLSMTSGRRWDDGTDRQMIRSAPDKTSFSVGLQQDRPPGEAWVYDNSAVQTLEAVLDDLGTSDVVEVANDRLLEPLGMSDTVWTRDAAGNALTYSGVESTCHDLARVGYLMLNDGRWEDQQIVPADYVREMTTASSDLNAAYGLLWWVNAEGRVVEVLRQAGFATDKAPYEGRLAPNVPDDAYWAFGYGNQYVAVVPSEGLVAVRLGSRPASPDQVTFDGFTAGVLEALDR